MLNRSYDEAAVHHTLALFKGVQLAPWTKSSNSRYWSNPTTVLLVGTRKQFRTLTNLNVLCEFRCRSKAYRILTIVVHLLKSDSMPFGICAETASMCLPGLNRRGLVVTEMALTSPVAPGGT